MIRDGFIDGVNQRLFLSGPCTTVDIWAESPSTEATSEKPLRHDSAFGHECSGPGSIFEDFVHRGFNEETLELEGADGVTCVFVEQRETVSHEFAERSQRDQRVAACALHATDTEVFVEGTTVRGFLSGLGSPNSGGDFSRARWGILALRVSLYACHSFEARLG
jgi:hypothetical protein